MSENKLPKIQDLHHDLQEAFKNDQLNLILNQPVPSQWIKEHPFAKNVKYIPIEKVEFLLTKIFQEWRVEILREGQMFNSVYVTIRLHYKNPISGEWQYHDGVGAVGVQTDAGKSAADLASIKQDAIMKALPAAESYAVKDAAEKLGVIFGKNLNRKDTIGFSETYKNIMQLTHPVFKEAYDNILTTKKTISHYESIYEFSEDVKTQLEKAQVQAIKSICDEANLDDRERDEYVLNYINEDATAEAIVNGLKSKYNITFINQL